MIRFINNVTDKTIPVSDDSDTGFVYCLAKTPVLQELL